MSHREDARTERQKTEGRGRMLDAGCLMLDVIARRPAPIELRLTPNWCGTT